MFIIIHSTQCKTLSLYIYTPNSHKLAPMHKNMINFRIYEIDCMWFESFSKYKHTLLLIYISDKNKLIFTIFLLHNYLIFYAYHNRIFSCLLCIRLLLQKVVLLKLIVNNSLKQTSSLSLCII